MNFKKIILFTLLLISGFINAQDSGKIIYKKKKIIKTFTKKDKKELGDETFKKYKFLEEQMNKAHKILEYYLLFNRKESLFMAQKTLNSPRGKLLKLSTGAEGGGKYYNSDKERIRFINSFGEDFLVSYPKTEWKLLNETKQIGNYLCYKALSVESIKTRSGEYKKYIIEAWYTPEINVRFGPIGFSGLPGLILELTRGKIKYFAEQINLGLKQKAQINKPKSGLKVTSKKYNELAIEAMGGYKKMW